MCNKVNLYFFICTVCIAEVILSSHVTDTTKTFGTSVLTTLRQDSSDEDDAKTAATAQTVSAYPQAVQTSAIVSTSEIAKSTSRPTTLEPKTTVVPSTEAPFSLECRDNPCPNQERCLIRRASKGTDYVCECVLERGSVYGFDCQYKYHGFFISTVPLRTCYGPECATGSQSSENYPNKYRSRTGQMMVIYVPGTYRFDLSFDDRGIGIEMFKDDLVIGGGFRPPFDVLPTEPEEKNKIQSVRHFSGDVTPDDFSIYNDSMWMWFQTDFNLNFKGFNVSWKSIAIDVECPEDIILNLPDDSGFVRGGWTPPTIRGAGVGIENVEISSNYDPNDNYTIGRYDVKYHYRDIFSNKAECNFRQTVRDITRPVVIDCPEDIELQTCNRSETIWMEPMAFDNSDEMVTEEMEIINGGGGQIQRGRNVVVYTFSDQSGNTQVCRFEVNIICHLDAPPGPVGIEFWIILAAAAGAIALLLLIIAFFAHAKLASIRADSKAEFSFDPDEHQGHKPGAPLEEEETLPNGKEKEGTYDVNGGGV